MGKCLLRVRITSVLVFAGTLLATLTFCYKMYNYNFYNKYNFFYNVFNFQFLLSQKNILTNHFVTRVPLVFSCLTQSNFIKKNISNKFQHLFNSTPECCGGHPSLIQKFLGQLIEIIETFSLSDIWRIRNPKTTRVSFRQEHCLGCI